MARAGAMARMPRPRSRMASASKIGNADVAAPIGHGEIPAASAVQGCKVGSLVRRGLEAAGKVHQLAMPG